MTRETKRQPRPPIPREPVELKVIAAACVKACDCVGCKKPSDEDIKALWHFIFTIQMAFITNTEKAKAVSSALEQLSQTIADLHECTMQVSKIVKGFDGIINEIATSCDRWSVDSIFSVFATSGAYTDKWSTLAPIIGGAFTRIMTRAGNTSRRSLGNGRSGAKVYFLKTLIPLITGEQPDESLLHQVLHREGDIEPPPNWPRNLG